jgi:TP901 family phage tail tape measure protein
MYQAAADVDKFDQSVDRTTKRVQARAEKMGQGMMIAGGLIAAGLALAVHQAAQFESKMSALQATSGATGGTLDKLRGQALAMGAATKFSADEAAQAQIELSKAGVSTSDILGGALPGALALAAAGELDVAQAAIIASQAMNIFNLKGRDVPRVADALAAGANKSAADVDTLAQGMNQVGLVADQMGLSMEQTVGTLSLFSQNALNGSDAGTSFKTMLQRLAAPTGEAKDLMNDLGLAIYDANGAMLPFDQIADNLQTSLQGMSQEQRNAAMQTLFGADAIRAANVLYSAGGEGVRQWTDNVSESGYAADLAAKKTDNLMGDVEELGGSFETFMIKLGSSGQGPAREVVQLLTGIVNAAAGLPAPVFSAAAAVAAMSSALLIFAGIQPKIVALNASLAAMGPAGMAAARGLSMMATAAKIGLIAAPAILGINYAIDELFGSAASSDELKNLAQDLETFGKVSERAQSNMLQRDLGGEFDKLEGAIRRVTNPGNLERLADIGGEITSLGGVLSQTGSDLSDAHQDIEDFNNALIELSETDPTAAGQAYSAALDLMIDRGIPAREAMDQLKEAREAVFAGQLPGADGTAESIEGVESAAEQAEQAVSDFKAELDSLFAGTLGVQEATDAVTRAIMDMKAQFEENGGAIQGNTIAALDNRDALRGIVQAQLDSLGAMADSGASQEELAFATGAAIGQLRTLAEQFPQLAPVIDDYIATLEGVPAEVRTTVAADTELADVALTQQTGNLEAWNNSRGTATVDADNSSARTRIQSSRDDVSNFDRSSGTADILGDNTQFGASRNWAASGLSSFDRSSGTADLNARDNASGTISKVARNLSALDGRSATVTITNREIRQQITEVGTRPMRMPTSRWGNITDEHGRVIAAQDGFSWDQASIVDRPTMLFGERETGGEAYVPRHGNRARSLGILEQAAQWHGADVVPNEARQLMAVGGGGTSFTVNVPVTYNVRATGGLDNRELARVVQEVGAAQRAELVSTLRRELNKRAR